MAGFKLKLSSETVDLEVSATLPNGVKDTFKVAMKQYLEDEREDVLKDLMGLYSEEGDLSFLESMVVSKQIVDKTKEYLDTDLLAFKDIKQFDDNGKLSGTIKDTRNLMEDDVPMTEYVLAEMWKYTPYRKALQTTFFAYVSTTLNSGDKAKN